MTLQNTSFMRPVHLPDGVSGELWLGPMLGRLRGFTEDMNELHEHKITLILNLTPTCEIEEKAPAYAQALTDDMNIAIRRLPITDFGVPDDDTEFFDLSIHAAKVLRSGGRIFIHYAAGIGRTGTMATCVLLALGMTVTQAVSRISDAGSGPETNTQKDLVTRIATRMQHREPVETSQ